MKNDPFAKYRLQQPDGNQPAREAVISREKPRQTSKEYAENWGCIGGIMAFFLVIMVGVVVFPTSTLLRYPHNVDDLFGLAFGWLITLAVFLGALMGIPTLTYHIVRHAVWGPYFPTHITHLTCPCGHREGNTVTGHWRCSCGTASFEASVITDVCPACKDCPAMIDCSNCGRWIYVWGESPEHLPRWERVREP
jgi:hypothetical protein